jgi:predicted RNA-binding protein with PIN domain
MPYLIDGNNLLGSWGGPALGGDGRHEVVRRVAAFCRARGARAIVVFDGAPFRPEAAEQHLGALTIRFPPEGRDADSLIREILDAAPEARDLVLVSSDKPLYSYARTRGARALRSQEWNALARDAGAAARARPGGARAAAPSEKPDHEPDVDGWLARFSRK